MQFDPKGAAERARSGNNTLLKEINGEFAIIHSPPSRELLKIVTCRFAYPTIFYSLAGGLLTLGSAFPDVWESLASRGLAKPNSAAFYDFLTYKRVFGDKTPEASTRLLGAARVLTYNGQKLTEEIYWQPDFRKKNDIDRRQGAEQLVEHVTTSIRRRTRDGRRYGLFLSGGMDTRLLLACFARAGIDPVCFTMAPHENREVQIARNVADLIGARHVFVPTAIEHHESVFGRAARLAGGQYLPMGMFIGLEDQISGDIDVGFHGHGFDYFFQGMYLPRWNPRILGRTLFLRLPGRLPDDLVGHFMNNISYKIREDLSAFMIPTVRAEHENRLRNELDDILGVAREITSSDEDAWEYLSFSNLARHYSCTDHWGINTLVEQRTASFDNDLYDFYQSVPTSLRFDARIQRAALILLSKPLADLPSANHRFPIRQSSAQRTLSQLADAGLRALHLRGTPADDRFERMSMPFDPMLAGAWRPLVKEMREAGRIANIDFVDEKCLNRYLDERLSDGNYSSYGMNQFLVGLLVIDQLLAQL